MAPGDGGVFMGRWDVAVAVGDGTTLSGVRVLEATGLPAVGVPETGVGGDVTDGTNPATGDVGVGVVEISVPRLGDVDAGSVASRDVAGGVSGGVSWETSRSRMPTSFPACKVPITHSRLPATSAPIVKIVSRGNGDRKRRMRLCFIQFLPIWH